MCNANANCEWAEKAFWYTTVSVSSIFLKAVCHLIMHFSFSGSFVLLHVCILWAVDGRKKKSKWKEMDALSKSHNLAPSLE